MSSSGLQSFFFKSFSAFAVVATFTPRCSSVLPVPYAFSRLGVLCGLLTQAVVAGCNALASVLLLKTASKVGRSSYEGTAEAVGGQSWKVVTQVCPPHKEENALLLDGCPGVLMAASCRTDDKLSNTASRAGVLDSTPVWNHRGRFCPAGGRGEQGHPGLVGPPASLGNRRRRQSCHGEGAAVPTACSLDQWPAISTISWF